MDGLVIDDGKLTGLYVEHGETHAITCKSISYCALITTIQKPLITLLKNWKVYYESMG